MSKHTQQEWQRDGATVYALNIEGTNRFVAQVQGGWSTQGRNRTDVEEVEANARLIAAAPDLLEALRDALCALECCGKDYQAATKARAAIAKATGAGHE